METTEQRKRWREQARMKRINEATEQRDRRLEYMRAYNGACPKAILKRMSETTEQQPTAADGLTDHDISLATTRL